MVVYILISILQFLGVGFHVGQKVISLGDKFPDETPRSILKVFWKEDWDTLTISFLIWILDIVVHFIVYDYLKIPVPTDWYWLLMPFLVSLILGYGGQRLIYKWFGSAEKFLDRQVVGKLD